MTLIMPSPDDACRERAEDVKTMLIRLAPKPNSAMY